MRKVRVAPKGMGLNDFVAEQEGFFAAEGIEVEWDVKTFRGTQSSWKGLDYKSRPQDRPYAAGDKSLIQCACAWGSCPFRIWASASSIMASNMIRSSWR